MITYLIASLLVTATNATVTLPTIIVEAGRIEKIEAKSPSHIKVISSKEIADSATKDIPSLLERVGGISVSNLGSGNPAMSQISMRGYGENGFGRVKILVDGENLANPNLLSPNYASVLKTGIDSVEILDGPQTVLYGDGASAGVINVKSFPSDATIKSYIETSAGSDAIASFATGSRGAADDDESVLYYADFSFDRSDGWRDNSDYEIYNTQAGLKKEFENASFLSFSTFFNNSDYNLPGPLSKENAYHNPEKSFYRDHAKLSSYGFNFGGKGVIDEDNVIKTSLKFSHRRSHFTNGDYTDIYGVKNLYSRDYLSNLYITEFSPQYIRKDDFKFFSNELTSGVFLQHNFLKSDAIDIYPQWDWAYSSECDITRLTGGFFAYDEIKLTENISATIGGRAERDWNRNNITSDSARTGNIFAYESALRYVFEENSKIFLRWTRFFRHPFIDEYRWRNGTEEGTTSPEKGWNVESGVSVRFFEEWKSSFTAYISETDNEIFYNPYLMSNENAAWKNRRTGFDASIGWEREKFSSLDFSISAVDAKSAGGEYKGKYIPGVPRLQMNLDGKIYITDEVDIFGGWRLSGARYAISDFKNSNEKLNSAHIFRAGARYKPQHSILEGFTLTFSVENIFDEKYCDYAVASVITGKNAYYPAIGRTFLLTIRHDF
jgi:iron complex outermembrane receptor protein